MLLRNLYYTAVLRARKKVIIVGDPDALKKAAANVRGKQRITKLAECFDPAREWPSCAPDMGAIDYMELERNDDVAAVCFMTEVEMGGYSGGMKFERLDHLSHDQAGRMIMIEYARAFSTYAPRPEYHFVRTEPAHMVIDYMELERNDDEALSAS